MRDATHANQPNACTIQCILCDALFSVEDDLEHHRSSDHSEILGLYRSAEESRQARIQEVIHLFRDRASQSQLSPRDTEGLLKKSWNDLITRMGPSASPQMHENTRTEAELLETLCQKTGMAPSPSSSVDLLTIS